MSFAHPTSPLRLIARYLIRARESVAVATIHTESIRPPQASAAYLDPARSGESSTSSIPDYLTPAQRKAIDAALRVDQAGEIAANFIYKGQYDVLKRNPKLRTLIQEMWDQEKKHLAVMNKLQVQHQVRPTLLWEVAKAGGYGLGVVTALMGKESAMACTEAVETVIGEHYDDQLKVMEEVSEAHPSVPLLKDIIREFRDDELEHLDIAVGNDSQRAPAHALLSTVIGAGCSIAIQLCKRF